VAKRAVSLALVLILLGAILAVTPAAAGSPNISWSPKAVELQAFPGTASVKGITFKATEDLSGVSLWVVPELQRFIRAEPQSFDSISAGTEQAVTLLVSIPRDTAFGVYESTLHIKVGRRTVPQTLKIILYVEEATADVIPVTISLPNEDRLVDDPDTGAAFVRDEILVGFVPGTPEEAVKAVVSGLGAVFLGAVPELDLYQIQVAVADPSELNQIMVRLEAEAAVSFAVRHWLYEVERTPYDRRFDTWDEGSPAGNNWGQELVGLPSAWEYATGDQSVRIAVVDSGFDVRHEDFGDNIYYSENVDLGVSRLVLPMWQAVTTHGTNVSGVISAQGNNTVGIAGVMWDSSLLLYGTALAEPRMIIGLTPRLDPLVAAGNMTDAIRRGARVINFSAGLLTTSEEQADRASAPYERVIEWTERTGRDALFVFSAGNESSDATLVAPATLARQYPNVVSVAAVGRTGELSSWSNFGSAVTVAAPGEDIYTTFPFNIPFGLSGDYGWAEGTSLAAPFVSGLAGLIWSVNPDLTAAEVKWLIVEGAEAGGRQVPGQSFHIINAYESVRLVAEPTIPESAWPMFGHDSQRTGQSTVVGPQEPRTKWAAEITALSSPVVDAEGTIYVIPNNNEVAAVTSGGAIKWRYSIGGLARTSEKFGVAVGTDGTIYAGLLYEPEAWSFIPVMLALNPDGTEKWRFIAEGVSQPAVDRDGNVVFAAGSYVYALTKEGTVKWTKLIPSSSLSAVAIGADGTVYVTDASGDTLYALDRFDGSEKWRNRPGIELGTYPVVARDGTVYVGGGHYEGGWVADVCAVEATGNERWRFVGTLEDWFVTDISVGSDGTVYAGAFNLIAVDPDGSPRWRASSGWFQNKPAIAADGTIYVLSTTWDGRYYYQALAAIGQDGLEKWRFEMGRGGSGAIYSDVSIAGDGTVLASYSKVYAFGPGP